MTVFEKIKSFDIEEMMIFLKAIEESVGGKGPLIETLYGCNHCPEQEICNDEHPCIYSGNWKLQYRGFLKSDCRELEAYLDGKK